MTTMLRRMVATAAIPMLLAGCGMSVLGHRSDVTKPKETKESKAASEREKAKTAPNGTKESKVAADQETPKRPTREEARAARLQQQALTVDREPKRDKHAPKASALDDAREQAALDPTQPYWPFHLAELCF